MLTSVIVWSPSSSGVIFGPGLSVWLIMGIWANWPQVCPLYNSCTFYHLFILFPTLSLILIALMLLSAIRWTQAVQGLERTWKLQVLKAEAGTPPRSVSVKPVTSLWCAPGHSQVPNAPQWVPFGVLTGYRGLLNPVRGLSYCFKGEASEMLPTTVVLSVLCFYPCLSV